MMRATTKRLMEIGILLAVALAFASFTSFLTLLSPLPILNHAELVMLDQAVFDRFGPGSRRAYHDILGFNEPEEWPPDKSLPAFLAPSNSYGYREFLYTMGMDHAPRGMRDLIDECGAILPPLRQVMLRGPYLSAPDEPWFARHAPAKTDFQEVSKVHGLLEILAIQQLREGNPRQARRYLESISMVHRSFQYTETAVLQRLLRNPSSTLRMAPLAWLDLPPGAAKLLRDHCESEYHYTAEALPAAFAAHNALRPEYHWREIGLSRVLNERYGLNLEQQQARLFRWTTLPAVRLRARQETRVWLETETLLPEPLVRRLDPLRYAFYRHLLEQHGDASTGPMLAARRLPLEALRAAFAARAWREEHGEWPDEAVFQSELIGDVPMEWKAVHDDDLTKRQLLPLFRIRTQGRELEALRGNEPDLVFVPLVEDFPSLWQEELPISQAEYEAWRRGAVAQLPFVREVGSTMSSTNIQPHLAPGQEHPPPPVHSGTAAMRGRQSASVDVAWLPVRLRLPQTTYWVVLPEPPASRDWSTEPPEVADAARYYLAGWDW